MNFTAVLKVAALLFQQRGELSKLIVLVQQIMSAFSPQQEAALRVGTHEVGSMSWLQESLNKLNNAGLAVDGDYGPATNAAVRAYQKAKGIEADGWAGPETVARIVEELSPVRT